MSIQDRDVFIVGAARTPLGSFSGSLTPVTAPKLGATAIRGALSRASIAPELVEEVLMGNVLSANVGQAPARQAALEAGLPQSVVCTTLNKVCSSGMKTVMLGAQSVMLGMRDVVVCGGMESMSNAPYYMPKARQGARLGHTEMVDGIIKDGLWDPYGDVHMGSCAEMCSEEYGFSREDADKYATESYQRAASAHAAGKFASEVQPVEVVVRKGKPAQLISEDEDYKKVDFAKMSSLATIFKPNGTVTAANASPISDGAAALVLVSGRFLKQHNLTPLARIRGFADAEQAPERFTTSPSLAIPRALAHAGVEQSQVDFFEINEAFAVVALANNKLLGLDASKVNVYGGAVALGHPIGCSGARILVTLLSVLRQENGRIGVAGICNGGGGASAMVLERC